MTFVTQNGVFNEYQEFPTTALDITRSRIEQRNSDSLWRNSGRRALTTLFHWLPCEHTFDQHINLPWCASGDDEAQIINKQRIFWTGRLSQ